jgi:hypothetical protein
MLRYWTRVKQAGYKERTSLQYFTVNYDRKKFIVQARESTLQSKTQNAPFIYRQNSQCSKTFLSSSPQSKLERLVRLLPFLLNAYLRARPEISLFRGSTLGLAPVLTLKNGLA